MSRPSRRAVLGLLAGAGLLRRATAAEAPPAAYVPRVIDATAARADLALMRRALETAHPGLTRYAPRAAIDAAFEQLQAQVGGPVDELALYRGISVMLAAIRCDHTKAELPEALERWRRTQASHLPLRFEVIEGRMIVGASDPAQPAIARGSEILRINGRPAAAVLRTLGTAVSIDGFTEPSRAAKLASDADLMGSGFDQFYPAFYGLASEFRLQVARWPEGRLEEHTLRPISFERWTALPAGAHVAPWRAEFHKTLRFELLDAKTALLTLPTFVNYRNPVTPESAYDPVFQALRQDRIEHLIVDLRGNGGGSTDVTVALARYLLDQPFVWNRPVRWKAIRFGDLEQHAQTWGNADELFRAPERLFRPVPESEGGGFEMIPDRAGVAEMLPMAPSPLRFAGRVTLLTDARNGSGTTMLVSRLVDERRVRVVGNATGGSAEGPTAGRLLMIKLPASGIVVRVPLMFNRVAVRSFRPGLGVASEREVPMTVADFVSGRDAVLEAAR